MATLALSRKVFFALAIRFGIPIVPMSIVGSYEFHRTGDWMLYPGKITVYLHDTIETKGMRKKQVAEADGIAFTRSSPRRSEEHIAQLAKNRFARHGTTTKRQSLIRKARDSRESNAPRESPATVNTTR